MEYSAKVGQRLRTIRRQRGMSLQDVARTTDGEFKAAVLGAYERGERSLSLPRLKRLAGFYEVPMSQLLPEEDTYRVIPPPEGGVTVDLRKVDSLSGETARIVDRFLQQIRVQRQDFNGKVLTIRATDVAMLALMLDMPSAEIVVQLQRDQTSI